MENIKKQPLFFPEENPRSDTIKNLITSMLKYKESDRISWDEIFKHDILTK